MNSYSAADKHFRRAVSQRMQSASTDTPVQYWLNCLLYHTGLTSRHPGMLCCK